MKSTMTFPTSPSAQRVSPFASDASDLGETVARRAQPEHDREGAPLSYGSLPSGHS